MSNLDPLMSSNNQEWETPQWLFDVLNNEFSFTLDPCATKNNAKCSNYFDMVKDGLVQSWIGHTVFMNPPYASVSYWMKKAGNECLTGSTRAVCLVPARVDTNWWWDNVVTYGGSVSVAFIKGRIKFVGASSGAPFPSALVIYGYSSISKVSYRHITEYTNKTVHVCQTI